MLFLRSTAIFAYAALFLIAMLAFPTTVTADGFKGVSRSNVYYTVLRLTLLRNVELVHKDALFLVA